MKDKIFELNKDFKAKLTELDLDRIYIFEVEIGDASQEDAMMMLEQLSKLTKNFGLKCLITTKYHGMPIISVTELRKYLETGDTDNVR